MNHTVKLIRIPGSGVSDVTVSAGMTLQTFVEQESLQSRSIIINGLTVQPDSYGLTSMDGVQEVFATGKVAGA